jgi:hypothetical protein
MPWLYLVLAVAALAIAFKTTSVAILVVCLVAALGLTLAWLMGVLARRIEARTGAPAMMIDPVELQRLREQAEARRVASQADAAAAVAQDPARPA